MPARTAAFIFAATGPVAIILTVGTRGALSPSDLSSWHFGAFFVNGLVSIFFCWFYRQPLVLFWSNPGTVLVGPALGHVTFPEVIGAFLATGALMPALGWSGSVGRSMEAVPMPGSGFQPTAGTFAIARPNLCVPVFSWQAMIELVVPLAITALVVQNGQGIAVLRDAGHQPPVNAITVACGVVSSA